MCCVFIRQNLRYTRCSFHLFMSMILPAASECEAAARAAESAGLLKAAKVRNGHTDLANLVCLSDVSLVCLFVAFSAVQGTIDDVVVTVPECMCCANGCSHRL